MRDKNYKHGIIINITNRGNEYRTAAETNLYRNFYGLINFVKSFGNIGVK